ncbi:pore-forming ESAT-6 family protein [Nesterenkonia salmonea]
MDRISFDTGVSSQVQSDVESIASRLESLIAERDQQVSAALSDFQMDGADAEYQQVESRWRNASHEVKNIITLIRQTMAENDQTATSTSTAT